MTSSYLAVDLGAESGRVMLGTLAEGKLTLEEVHRFENRTVTIDGHLHWDFEHLEREIFVGLERGAQQGVPISGISTDSWGVDYVLLDRNGKPISPPFCYRDARNQEGSKKLVEKLSFPAIYGETGIQFLPFNTLYQLFAEKAAHLSRADRLLTVADYFNAQFSGREAIDQSMASTTQFYDPRTAAWSSRLLADARIDAKLLPPIVPSGTVLGPVIGKLKSHPALADAKVVATCSHDTGEAVAAVPAMAEGHWAYLSSGTWSLLGAECAAPIISDASREAGFTNEVGLGGTIRFLKNIAGLWVVQECRRAWKDAGQDFSYDDLARFAVDCGPAAAHLSLSDPRFVSTGKMPEKIAAYCRETSQPVPTTPGEVLRTVLESLALTYAKTLRELEKLIGHKVEVLHIVGGGIRNELLNQLTADAVGLPVVAGPVEATAIGNVLIQALALGHLSSREQVRRTVEASFPTRIYKPSGGLSDDRRARFQKLQPSNPTLTS